MRRWLSVLSGIILSLGLITPLSTVADAGARGHRAICERLPKLIAGCGLSVSLGVNGEPYVTPGPAGFGPATWHSAYNVATTATAPTTMAVVSAYDQPHLLEDLNTYNQAFGLPATPACTTATQTACLAKLDQRGGTKYPAVDGGWSLETSLDTETIHGMCQDCRLVVVEADTASLSDLFAAVDRAVTVGAKVVSNSYGTNEFFYESQYDWHFKKPGVMFLFASGDSGYGTGYPAASPYVTAVGGTSLAVDANGARTSETVWSGAGSGCSRYESKPSWQKDTSCRRRMIADTAAVADPNTGAAVYSSVPYSGSSGWFVVGGTSLATPIVAGVYALAGGATGTGASQLYAKAKAGTTVTDITVGANGNCYPLYLCHGTVGYDGPTGVGVPLTSAAY